MPYRTPSLAERLRSVWAHEADVRRPFGDERSAPARHDGDKASEFADRLRAAVAARH